MKPAAFVHHRPRTLDEACRLLAEVAPEDGRVIAGGQSLVPIMAFRMDCKAAISRMRSVMGPSFVAKDAAAPLPGL